MKDLELSIDNKSSAVRLREIVSVLKRHGVIHGVSPNKLKLILEDLGPTYVKFGQLMSMRSDVLPREYCDVLVQLRTDVKPIPYEEVIGVIEAEYGLRADEVFQEISREHLGSASIAQVHKAVLRNGQTVVIKVQRPGIYQMMKRDIQLLKRAISITKIFKINVGNIDFKLILDEMWAAAQQEMDFIIEANYIQEITDLNADIKYIAFPRVERDLTTSKVLVMEYIDGVQIDELEKLAELGYDINEIGIKLADNYVKQIVDDGLFHADPHPGNIYIRDGQIVWLDLGMMGRINNRDRRLLKKTISSILQQDVQGLVEVFLATEVIKGKVNFTKLYEDIESMLTRYGDMELADIHLGFIMQEVKDILNFHQISLPSGLSLLARGLVTIEGVLAACSPQVNLMEIVANHASGTIFKEIDFKKELLTTTLLLHSFGKHTLALPEQYYNVLQMLLKGQTRINIDLTAAEPVRRLDLILNKLLICLLSAAFIIGASIIYASGMPPHWYNVPVLALVGYLLAMLLAGWVIKKIIRRRY
jgi:ubiquinone biosynthesis protein